MTEVHELMLPAFLLNLVVLALFAGIVAALANNKRPLRKPSDLAIFTVTALCGVLLTLTIGLMTWFMSTPCPANSVCDAGAMAAGGVVMLGAIEVVITLCVGAPVAYFTIRYVRSR